MIEITFQFLSEKKTRAMESHLDIGLGQVEDLARFGCAESFNVPQDQNHPVFFRQIQDRCPDGTGQLFI
jgi:hypothetical protein